MYLTDSCADNNYKLEAWGSDLKQTDTGRVSTLEKGATLDEIHDYTGFFCLFFPEDTHWPMQYTVRTQAESSSLTGLRLLEKLEIEKEKVTEQGDP